MPMPRALAFIVHEFKEMIPPTLFFAAGFNLIVLTTQLILDDYKLKFLNFMVATTAALVVGKSVLVANALPFLRRLDGAPLIQPILFKTLVYFAVVFLVRLLEKIIEYVTGGGTLAGFPEYVSEHFTWHRFAAVQIWILVLFLIYTTAAELNSLFGDGELVRVFFTRNSSELKLTRRQRIRTLVKLSRLTQAHTLDELRDRGTVAHADLFGLIGGLAMRPGLSRNSPGYRQQT
jgi:hypothetical protein